MNELFMYIVKKIFLIKITLQVTINRKFGLTDVMYIDDRILFSHKRVEYCHCQQHEWT